MTEVLYLLDCYLKEFEASVESVKDDKYVVLDKTGFYPNAGGQPYDTGKFIKDGEEFKVVFVAKFGDIISHEVDTTKAKLLSAKDKSLGKPGLKPGDKIKGVIDWDRRYKLMRMHTAAHVIANVIEKEAGAKITGNQLGLDKSRIDFSLEDFDREKFAEYEKKANEIINKGLNVNLSIVPRAEAEEKLSRITTLAAGFPEDIKEVRLVELEGFTIEACGGTHVKNTSEIKGIKILKLENKGKNNRRMYYGLVD